MTISIVIFRATLITIAARKIKNPIKLRVALILYRAIIFLIIIIKTGAKWFPILYFLLFIGGILIIFIVLSSIIPNEKPGKSKITYPAVFTFFVLGRIFYNNIPFIIQSTERIKTLLSTSIIIPILRIIIILYFFLSIEMLKRVKLPIRTVSCQKES